MFIDSHAHLEGKRYDADRDDVLRRAKDAGVAGYLAIGNGDGPTTADCGIRLAEHYKDRPDVPQIWASIGVHPHEASLASPATDDQMRAWAKNPRVIAWGEIGLDYFYDHSPRETQIAVFRRQMELAGEAKLPIIIHCRPSDNSENAWEDCLSLIEQEWSPHGLGGVLHCFTGSLQHAKRGLDLGFLVSFAGNVTFPKAQAIREAAQFVPLDRMLIETDSPYLAPIPNRGKRNEPSFVLDVAREIAVLRQLSPEEVGAQTADTFRQFFRIASRNNPA